MSTGFVTEDKLQEYATNLEEFRSGETSSKENFTALAGDIETFSEGLNPFQFMANFPAIHDLQSLLSTQ